MINKNMKNERKLEIMRHSWSHVMAAAVRELWPKVKFAIGPAIENGFYYDFDFSKIANNANKKRIERIGEEDLAKIEKKMKHIIKQNLKFSKSEMSVKDALAKEKKAGEKYKQELISDLKAEGEKKVSYYQVGEFADLCRGPHVKSTGELDKNAFKLTKLAGAYWRGNEKNKMLTRIYGVAFASKKELDEYLEMMAEAEKRNHIKLGKELDLFSMHEEGPGFPFFHNKGLVIWNQLMKYWKEEHNQEGYQEIKTPIILNKKLWEQSGHWDNYKENMYFTKIDDDDYAVKPMNCPGGILIYKSAMHSYKELPLKIAEIGLVHRHELSGTLNGLFRVRAFHQDDAHIYSTEEQMKTEVIKVIKLYDRIYKKFDLQYHMELSTKPKKCIGSVKMWKVAENALASALKDIKAKYELNPGDGAFYGPKIDFHIKDSIGRTWQCGTIQLDFAMPEKFKLKYIGQDGKEHRPVMIHRTAYGAIERFMGIIIEHYAGAFPVWLSPVQVKIVSVGEKHVEFSEKLAAEFKKEGIRVEVDSSDETVGNKIRKSVGEKVPYMLVVGDKEIKSRKLAVRDRGEAKIRNVAKRKFIDEVKDKVATRD